MLEAGQLALILDPDRPRAGDSLFAGCLLLEVEDSSIGSAGLSNSQVEAICLISPNGDCVDQVLSRPELQEDHSLERRLPGVNCDGCWLEGRWPGGTPGTANSRALRDHELEAELVEDGISMQASGQEGFHGSAIVEAGLPGCLQQREQLLELAPDDSFLLEHGPLPVAGSCSLKVFWQALDGSRGLALDTLLARKALGMLSLEAIELNQPQWLQLRSRSGCPLLLEGMELRWRSGQVDLAGMLPAGASLLISSSEIIPACPPGLHVPASLSIGLSEGLDLLDVDGSLLDQARWPLGERSCWLRRSGQPDGANPDSWQQSTLQAGCQPIRQSGFTSSTGFEVNSRSLSADESLCATGAEGTIRLELWSLGGQLLASQEGYQACCLPSRRSLNLGAGLYLLRAQQNGQGAELIPVAFKP